jgi:alpha-tubulin suppressor-like RCC1 family protein
MANTVTQTITASQGWTAPPGVVEVMVTAVGLSPAFDQSYGNGNGNQNTPGTSSYGGVLDTTGKLWGWGQNVQGGIGAGTNTTVSSPISVVGGLTWSKFWKTASFPVSASNDVHTTWGLTTSGALYGWGKNASGEIGQGTQSAFSSPVLVAGGLTWANFFPNTAGYGQFAMTPGGQLYGWGQNTGSGSTSQYSSPVLVAGGLTWAKFFPGVQFFAGITQQGALYQWGTGYAWGNSTSVSVQSSPVLVLGGITNWAQVALDVYAYSHVYGITYSGALYSWGNNSYGELGDGTTTGRSSPVLVVGGLSFQAVFPAYDSYGGTSFALGLTTGGQLYGWGYSQTGLLGNGNAANGYSSPVLVAGGLTFSKVLFDYVGANVFAVTTGGQLYAWGANTFGQLGDGTTSTRSSPVLVLGGINWNNLKQLSYINAAGAASGVTIQALMNNGSIYAWGSNNGGLLGNGDGTLASKSSPVLVVGGLSFSQVQSFTPGLNANGGTYVWCTMGITNTGQIYAWGEQTFGDLGAGVQSTGTAVQSSPVLVVGALGPNFLPTLNSIVIPVTPGQTYNVTLGSIYSTFGTQVIGQAPLSQIIVSYEQ